MSAAVIGGLVLGLQFAEAAIPYTLARLNEDLSAGVESILAGSGGDYLMDVNATNSTIVLSHKFAAYKGTSPSPGPGRSAIGITAAGIAMGYNDPSTGVWKDAIAISATGDVTILGTLKAGSVIETSATVGGTPIGTIASKANGAAQASSLGALATQNTVNLATQVVGQLSTGSITGLGALALLNQVSLSSSQVTGSLPSGSVSGLGALATQNTVNANTQVTNLGALAYANYVAANLITAGTVVAGVTISGSVDTANYIHAYGSNPTAVTVTGNTRYPTIYGESSVSAGVGVIGTASSPSGVTAGVLGYSAYGNGVIGWAASTGSYGVLGQSQSASGVGVYSSNGGGGTSLYVNGTMSITSSAQVANLNANYLQGNTAAAFATYNHTHASYVQIAGGATNGSYLYFIDTSAPSNQSTRAGWLKIANNGGTVVWVPFYT